MNPGLLLMIGGGLMSSGSSAYGGLMAIKQSKYAQDILDYQAEYVNAAIRIEEAKLEREKNQTLSTQKAMTAASGIRTDVGAPVEIAAETEILADIDKNILRISGGIEQIRLKTQGTLAKAQGYATGSALFAQGTGSLLSTAMSYGQHAGWGPGTSQEPNYPRNYRSF